MVQGINLKRADATVSASGDTELIAGDSTVKHRIYGWTLNVDAAQNVLLFEYGTGSVILDRLNGTASGAVSNLWLGNQPYLIGAGSSVHLAVDGTAEASAVVYYTEE